MEKNKTENEQAEKFFWADKVAEDIIRDRGKKTTYVCASGVTPSGVVHFGNFREVITTELVVRALKDKGKKVKFIYSWDDYDRFRKVPLNLPDIKEYQKFLGMPLSEIPSPFGEGKSYPEYFEGEAEKSMKSVGIQPKFIRQSLMNKKCEYAELIKRAFDKIDEIKNILNKYRKEPLENDWMPVEVYSRKTGKDDTKILKVDGYNLTYEDSTGFSETIDYRKIGNVKMKWRVDWPARWSYEKVDFEPGGIDHSVDGGSYTTSKEISKEVFKYNPPHYQFYDWIKPKGGSEFSSSEGNALSVNEVMEIYEPEIIRYFFAISRPNKGLQISFDNDVIKMYDEYDELERKYYDKEVDEKEKRIYEMCQLKKIPESKPHKINFRHLATLIQTGKTRDLDKDMKKRAEKVRNWLDKYADEDMKFSIQERVNMKLDKKQRDALIKLKESLYLKTFNEDELTNEIYEICKEVGIESREFFEAAYGIIIGKTRGPRLASLILAAGKKNILNLLDQIKDD
jgi:lysyl-tRNA synthetase, class I